MTVFITHSKVQLALHELRSGRGRPLLLLHGLGEQSSSEPPAEASDWPGTIYALDFTGHGKSSIPLGGGYTAEMLMGDVDAAALHVEKEGPVTIWGRGLGGYVGLLFAGARPGAVHGLIIDDGPGLAGGGSRPGSPRIAFADLDQPAPPDPFAVEELSLDVRPPDYAATFARQATMLSTLEVPISVVARSRPDWLQTVVEEPGVQETTIDRALAFYLE